MTARSSLLNLTHTTATLQRGPSLKRDKQPRGTYQSPIPCGALSRNHFTASRPLRLVRVALDTFFNGKFSIDFSKHPVNFSSKKASSLSGDPPLALAKAAPRSLTFAKWASRRPRRSQSRFPSPGHEALKSNLIKVSQACAPSDTTRRRPRGIKPKWQRVDNECEAKRTALAVVRCDCFASV